MKKKSPWKNIINISLLILVTGVVLYFSLKDNFEVIVDQIFNVNKWWLLVALFLMGSYWFLKSIVIYRSVGYFKKDYTMRDAVHLTFVTQFFNAVTPFSSGGQPFQVYTLKKKGLTIPEATNVIIQDFIVYQIALVLLGTLAIIANALFHLYPEVGLLKQLVTIGFTLNFAVIIILFLIAFSEKMDRFFIHLGIKILDFFHLVKDKEKKIESWNHYIHNFHDGAVTLVRDKKHLFKLIFLNFLALCCLYLVPLVILFSMGNYTAFNGLEAIITSAYVMLIGAFVPIPGGTGGLEYSFIAFYGNFITGSVLRAMMLLWRFITYYLGMILGGIALNFKRNGK